MINIEDLSTKIREEGYKEEMAEAKLCQDNFYRCPRVTLLIAS